MTRKQFQQQVKIVTGIYLFALLVGIIVRVIDVSDKNIYYKTFQDLLSLIVALPAAYLGYCIQQRVSFLQVLRTAWSNLVKAVNNAILYTQNEEPEKKEYFEVLFSLRIAIDEIRGIYRNVGENPGSGGFYPMTPVETIYQKVETLPFGKLTTDDVEKRKKIGQAIFEQWKSIRGTFLSEFDRPEPTKADISLGSPALHMTQNDTKATPIGSTPPQASSLPQRE